MPIDAAQAYKLVRGLSGLNYYPSDDDAVGLLLKAMQAASSVEAGEAFVDHWTLTLRNRDCPKPGDILDYFQPPKSSGEFLGSPQSTGCSLCGGSGWIIVERKGVEGAKKCTCIAA